MLRTALDPWIHLNEHLGYSEQAQMHKSLFFDGKIDYQGWVDRDAALWKGIHRDRILQALDTNPLKPGATELLNWFKTHNIPIIDISTGLDAFNNVIAQQFSFKFIRSNELLFDEHNVCLGIAKIHVIEDGKGEILKSVLAELSIAADAVAVFGDGSADIGMFKIAGLSVAVSPSNKEPRSKPQ